MDLCVSTYSLAKWRRNEGATLEHCLDWLAGLGLHQVELSGLGEQPYKNPIQRARTLRKRCDRLGLQVASYCTGGELLQPPNDQRREIGRIKEQIDIAAELGAPSMRHDVTKGPRNGQSLGFKSVLKRIAPAVRELTEHGQQQGVITSLENHGFYMQTVERVSALIEEVDHDNYGLTIDLGNFLCLNQDPVDAAKRLGRYVVMAHAKDFHIKKKKDAPPPAPQINGQNQLGAGWIHTPTTIAIRGAVTGHGDLNLPAQLKALDRAGYDGPLSVEFEGLEEPRQAVRLGLAYLEQQLEAL